MCNDVSPRLRDESEQLVKGRGSIRKSRKGRCGITQRYPEVLGEDCQRQKTKSAVHTNHHHPRKVICVVNFVHIRICNSSQACKCNLSRSCGVILIHISLYDLCPFTDYITCVLDSNTVLVSHDKIKLPQTILVVVSSLIRRSWVIIFAH